VRPGDRIAATLVVSDSRSWLEEVRVTGRDGTPRPRVSAAARASVGTEVPDLPLIDQHGAAITLRGGGRVRVITFIYTRCPLPDFCPLMVQHLERVRRRVAEAALGSGVGFVGITLDPAFDSPEVLRAYGESVLSGADRFDDWTLATGTVRQVQDAARFFGVGAREADGVLTHTLMTVVVAADGRIVRLLPSNDWRPDDLYEVIRRTAGAR
jgi:protein SCO1/2